MSWNWLIVAVFATGLAAILAAEAYGINRNKDHRVDTITELWYALRDRLGPWHGALAFVLAGVFMWAWYHLSIEGRRR